MAEKKTDVLLKSEGQSMTSRASFAREFVAGVSAQGVRLMRYAQTVTVFAVTAA